MNHRHRPSRSPRRDRWRLPAAGLTALIPLAALAAAGPAAAGPVGPGHHGTAHHRVPTYRNPVVPADAPDPDVVLVGATYYAFATGGPGGPIQLFTSTDLASWAPTAWPGPLVHDAAWSVYGREWAPGVAEVGGRWVLYYATEEVATGAQCITEATSLTVTGPYVNDTSGPLACGAIDPSPYEGPGGTDYLEWRGLGPGGTAEILSEQLGPGGTAFAPGTAPAVLVTQSQRWETTVENPDLVHLGGRYLLLFSGGQYTNATYATGYATCDGPLGPCVQSDGPWLSSSAAVVGPGGASAFTDAAGRWWLAYAAMAPGAAAHELFGQEVRSLRIDRLCLVAGAPVLLGPTTGPEPLSRACPAG